MSSSDATMSSPLFIPSALQFYVNRLSFSKNRVRLQALSTQVASANTQVIVRLPSNTMINLASLTMTGGVRATITNAAQGEGIALPTNYDLSFIETLSLIANGGIITQPFINYKLLANTLNDVYGNDDKNASRSGLQGSLPPCLTESQLDYQPFAINNWISATQTMAPSYISTNLLGDLELRLTMANNSILATGDVGSGKAIPGLQSRSTWDMNNLNFYVETASIESVMLDQAIAAKLAGGEPINVPFENVFSFQQANNSGTYNQRFSVSSQSVNKILAISQLNSDTSREAPSVLPKVFDIKDLTDEDNGLLAYVETVGDGTAAQIKTVYESVGWVGTRPGIQDKDVPTKGDVFVLFIDPSSTSTSTSTVIIYEDNEDAEDDPIFAAQQTYTNGIPSVFRRNSVNTTFAQFSVNNQYSPNYQIDSQVNKGYDLVTNATKNYQASNVLVETRAAMDIPDYDYDCADKLTSTTQMPFEYFGGGFVQSISQLPPGDFPAGAYPAGSPIPSQGVTVYKTYLQPPSQQLVSDASANARNPLNRWIPYRYRSGIDTFLNDKYLLATSFDLDVCDKDRLVSGINTLGSNAQMFLNVVGGAGRTPSGNEQEANVSTVFVLCTSMVQIYQGATLQIIQ